MYTAGGENFGAVQSLFEEFYSKNEAFFTGFSAVLQVIHKKIACGAFCFYHVINVLTYPPTPYPLSDKFVIIGFGYLPTPDYYVINERSLTERKSAYIHLFPARRKTQNANTTTV